MASHISYIQANWVNFWWNNLEFSDKLNITIQIRIFNKVTHRYAICLKSEDRFFTSLTMLELKAKTSICSTIKENLILYCCKFSDFCRCHKLTFFHKETPLVKEIVKFAIETLKFQNSLFDGVHSIWDIKLPWAYI